MVGRSITTGTAFGSVAAGQCSCCFWPSSSEMEAIPVGVLWWSNASLIAFHTFLPELFLKLPVGSLASNHSPGASISRLIISAFGKLIKIVLNAVC